MAKRPWYSDGLQFECTQCGGCCTGFPGHVWVTQPEIDAIAVQIGMTSEEVERKFVIQVGDRKSIKDLPQANFDCVFFDSETRGCHIYPVRPTQCRTFPFWDSTLESPRTWKANCKACPGSGVGRLYSLGEIEARRVQVDV